MIIPNKIKIAGKLVTIKRSKTLLPSDSCFGTCEYQKSEIKLAKSALGIPDRQNVEQTLIHELVHFCNAILGKGNTECDGEEYVQALSELLYQIIEQL